MKYLLLISLFICTSFASETEIETYINSTGVSKITHAEFETIFNKINLSNIEIEKIIINEIEWDVGGFSINVCVFSKRKDIKYYFGQNRESKIKSGGKEKIIEEEECIGQHIDGIFSKIQYILPFTNNEFVSDSAKYIICQSRILEYEKWLKRQK